MSSLVGGCEGYTDIIYKTCSAMPGMKQGLNRHAPFISCLNCLITLVPISAKVSGF